MSNIDANLSHPDPEDEQSALASREWIVATIVPEPPQEEQEPPRTTRRPRFVLPAVLFVATCLSTYLVGSILYGSEALLYAVPLMTILVCHEAGHFIQARRYHVPASLPFFIPLPIPPIGTIGAVIGMSPSIPNRKALYDIGISGPLAGLVPTMICVVVGLSWSHVGVAPDAAYGGELGESLLFKALAWLQFGEIPAGHTVYLHPLGVAGWVGLLITSLNLFPIGQLDGGHVLYALLRQKAHGIATFLLIAAALSVFAVASLRPWIVMIVLLMFMGPRHMPTRDDATPLGTWRVVLGWLTLAFLPLGFTPIPFPQF